MSWQAYVDNNMVGSKSITQGAIFGLAGGKWACSPGFNISDAEAAFLVKGFTDPNAVRATSPLIEGEKFIVVKADDRSIYAKKGKGGLVAVKTTQCVLIGLYGDGVAPGAAAMVVEKLADYLIELGY